MESSRILIDTSIVIDYLRSNSRQQTNFTKLFSDNELYLSSISVFELFNGATSEAKKQDVEQVCQQISVLDFNLDTAKIASEIYLDLRAKNKLIEFRDILIAASALQHTLPIATLNRKHFERIEWLELVWKHDMLTSQIWIALKTILKPDIQKLAYGYVHLISEVMFCRMNRFQYFRILEWLKINFQSKIQIYTV